TWTRSRARWRFRWERLAPPAKPPAARCCCGFSTSCSARFSRPALAEAAGKFQHRIEPDLRARGALLLTPPLRFVVRNATAAWHKDHGGRRHAGNVDGVMTGARDDVPMRKAGGFDGDAYAIDQVWRKVHRWRSPDPAFAMGELKRRQNFSQRLA